MCTALPVFRGEIQCRLLGMAVAAYTPAGAPAAPGEAGELVCLRPFPCQPAGFWPLAGYGSADAVADAQRRFRDAYFVEFDGVWCEFALCLLAPSPPFPLFPRPASPFSLLSSPASRSPSAGWPSANLRTGAARVMRVACVRCRCSALAHTVHGDHIVITRSQAGNGGGMVMLGRSDGVL